MLLSIALYLGVGIIAVGLLSIIRPLRWLRIHTRRRGGMVVLAGAVLVAAALAFPAREKHATGRGSLLDEFMPVWQFDERHETRIHASPARVFTAIHQVTAGEILLFRTLTAIRRGGRSGPENILNAPERLPLIDVATRTTFILLIDAPPRELVVGTVLLAPPNVRRNRDVFREPTRPGIVLATMNFLVKPDERGGSVVSTETRVFASSRSARRRFAVYWRFIHPGSDLIRRMWLRSIKRRAESNPTV